MASGKVRQDRALCAGSKWCLILLFRRRAITSTISRQPDARSQLILPRHSPPLYFFLQPTRRAKIL